MEPRDIILHGKVARRLDPSKHHLVFCRRDDSARGVHIRTAEGLVCLIAPEGKIVVAALSVLTLDPSDEI